MLLTRYANFDYILRLPFMVGLKFIRKAIDENTDKRIWQMWLAIYPHMTKENFISFEDYKKQCTVQTKEQTDEQMLAKVKILNAMFGGEVVEVYE